MPAPPQHVSYKAGLYTWTIVCDDVALEYTCPPFLEGRIPLDGIVAVGISDDRHMDGLTIGGEAMQKLAGVKDGLGGLMIAYRVAGKKRPQLSTIAFDYGDVAGQAFVLGFVRRYQARFLGVGTRGELAKQMGVRRTFETVVAVGVVAAIVVVTGLVQFC